VLAVRGPTFLLAGVAARVTLKKRGAECAMAILANQWLAVLVMAVASSRILELHTLVSRQIAVRVYVCNV
jgi:hypothetical protein